MGLLMHIEIRRREYLKVHSTMVQEPYVNNIPTVNQKPSL